MPPAPTPVALIRMIVTARVGRDAIVPITGGGADAGPRRPPATDLAQAIGVDWRRPLI
jgi:hypothetical protein